MQPALSLHHRGLPQLGVGVEGGGGAGPGPRARAGSHCGCRGLLISAPTRGAGTGTQVQLARRTVGVGGAERGGLRGRGYWLRRPHPGGPASAHPSPGGVTTGPSVSGEAEAVRPGFMMH